MEDEPVPTYSISMRLRRTTTEVAVVNVLVTPDMIVAQPDGTGRLDVDLMVSRAVAMGKAPGAVWEPEEQTVEPHPIQSPPPGYESPAAEA